MGRRIRWLGIVMMLCFGLVLVQLVNIQFRRAAGPGRLHAQPPQLGRPTTTTSGAASWPPTAPSWPSRCRSTGGRRTSTSGTYPPGALFAEIVGYDSRLRAPAGSRPVYNTYLDPHTQPATTLGQLLSPPRADHRQRDLDHPAQAPARRPRRRSTTSPASNKDGAVVVSTPPPGPSLAMYSNPTFDPNPWPRRSLKVEDAGRAGPEHQVDAEGFSARHAAQLQRDLPARVDLQGGHSAAVYDLKPTLANFTASRSQAVHQAAATPTSCCATTGDADHANPCGGNMIADAARLVRPRVRRARA